MKILKEDGYVYIFCRHSPYFKSFGQFLQPKKKLLARSRTAIFLFSNISIFASEVSRSSYETTNASFSSSLILKKGFWALLITLSPKNQSPCRHQRLFPWKKIQWAPFFQPRQFWLCLLSILPILPAKFLELSIFPNS